jgi:hypothetical protein
LVDTKRERKKIDEFLRIFEQNLEFEIQTSPSNQQTHVGSDGDTDWGKVEKPLVCGADDA